MIQATLRLAVFLSYCGIIAGAEPFIIQGSSVPVTALSSHLSLLEDPTNKLSIKEFIQGSCSEQFVDNHRPIAAAGFTSSTIWLHCRIENRSGDEVRVVTESSMARLSHATWYLVQNQAVLATVKAGAMDQDAKLAATDQYPKISFALAPHSQVDLYMRVESDTNAWFPMIIASEDHFRWYDRIRTIRDNIMMAICAMIAVTSIFIGFSNRQSMYLNIAVVAAIYGVIFAIFNGHIRAIFPSLPIWWERQFYGSVTVFGMLAMLLIDRKIIDLDSLPKWIIRARAIVISIFVIGCLLQLFLDYRISAKYVFTIVGIGVLIYAILCLYIAWNKGNWMSSMMAITWSVTLGNFFAQQIAQSYIKPNTLQTLILPAILSMFLIALIRHQTTLAQTKIKLSNSMRAESEARLAALRSQLDPHFLFNALTSVDALSRSNPARVPEIVERLASFLRFRLTPSQSPFRPLNDEIQSLKAYLDIEKVRFGDQLNVVFDISSDTFHCQVPELILQPLVENAIKHGFQIDQPVELLLHSQFDQGGLKLKVANRCPENQSDPSENGFGIGISNTKERLKYLYGDQASLQLTQADRIFTASLWIPQTEAAQ